MTQFRIDRLRFTWKGNWTGATVYNKDDIVRYGGKAYVCLVGHTSTAVTQTLLTGQEIITGFYTDLNQINTNVTPNVPNPYWTLWIDGYSWQGVWVNNTLYNAGDVVSYNGTIYICNTPHVSVPSNLSLLLSSCVPSSPTTGSVTYNFTPQSITPFLVGSNVTVAGFSTSGFNGTFAVTASTLSSVTVSNSTTGSSSSVSATISGQIQLGLEYNQSYWSYYEINDYWIGVWTTGYRYKVDDIVKYGGTIYRATAAHVSSNLLETDIANWQVVIYSDKWTTDWTLNTHYRVNDVVRYGGIVYRCLTAHNSASTNNDPSIAPPGIPGGLEANRSNWQVVISGTEYKSLWSSNFRYKLNDTVKYGANIYQATIGHQSGSLFDIGKWSLYLPGQKYRNSWNGSIYYVLGDVVDYGGNSYVAIANNLNQDPSTSSLSWSLLTIGYLIVGEWNNTSSYQPGDVVRRHGNLYVAITDSAAFDPNTTPNSAWTLIVSGTQWQNRWAPATQYDVGDIVTYLATSYVCILQHTSTSGGGGNSPIADISQTYWNVFVQGDHFEVLANLGDITTYNTVTKQTAVPIGSVGNVLKSNGIQPYWQAFGQVNDVYYVSATTGVDAPGYGLTLNAPFATVAYACNYVQNGAYYQNTAYLLSSNKQWMIAEMYNWMVYEKTNSISPFSPTSSYDQYKTQRDAEYIIDSIIYDITRGGNSQTVASALSFFIPGTNTFLTTNIASEIQFFTASLSELANLMQNAITNTAPTYSYQALTGLTSAYSVTVTGASGNGSTATLTFGTQTNIPFTIGESILISSISPTVYNGTFTVTSVSPTSVSFSSTATAAYNSGGSIVGSALVQNIDGTRPAENGATVVVSSLMNIIITALTNQSTASLPPTNTGVTSTINIKDGTYNEIIPIIVPENTALVGDELRGTIVQPSQTSATFTGSISGSTLTVTGPVTGTIVIGMWVSASTMYYPTQITSFVSGISGGAGLYTVNLSQTISTISMTAGYITGNMFYCRNGSGIRNMTLSGLTGSLGPLNTYLTGRPTAGAYVSLDPGFGPQDTSAWIFRKSPYVQNVTTFGSGCAGLKIDGSLHAGGNKSIVANDFTQVLSDGIGVWATGSGALTECVSVFTYYNHAGYLSELGGKIRATNGNNSYGTYGSVAEGYDILEVPLTGTVNNEYYPAQVVSAFAGQAQNKILLLEFSNCGETYTNASIAFSGAGTGASVVVSEFRDNAIFEAHLTGASAGLGGSGYITAGNQAQGGNTTTIVIAQNDPNTITNYQGMRIIIVSGTGVGQYGYINAYNTTSKTITVFTESSGVAGWDHVIPGYPIASLLDSTTQYSIEPRPQFSNPPFVPNSTVLPAAGIWISTAYGNGIFVTIDGSGLSAYSSNGIAWSPGSILPVGTYTSLAYGSVPNLFVAVTGGLGGASTTAAYSSNGSTWSSAVLPVSAVWNSVTYGNGYFVAIGTSAYLGSGNSVAVSTNGTTWTSGGNLPSSQQWSSVAYGLVTNTFVAVSTGTSNTAAYSTNNGVTWTATTLPNTANWVGVTYGNNRFVAVSSSSLYSAYSLDGITWSASNGLPSTAQWTAVSYGQGLFMTIAYSSSSAATSQDGINWVSRSVSTSANWTSLAFGNPAISGNVTPTWVAVSTTGSSVGLNISAGATAMGRIVVTGSAITLVKIWDPGSGYTSVPSITITDPNVLINGGSNANIVCRLGKGVLCQPTWVNRGQNYQTTTTVVTVSGNGYADIYQGTDGFLIAQGITVQPTPGANLVISGIVFQYSITAIVPLGGTTYKFTLSVNLDNAQTPLHGTTITIRLKYSQVRLTGHDFLYIGTGNFNNTNYPNVPIQNALQNQQIQYNNAGRVFVMSTDQDGNFKVGNLFGVQQATGIVTISASLFNLSGVTALSLGGVSVGQNAVIITQFSTDSYFIANSDAIIPTQRAIKSYIARAVSTGGANAAAGTVIAGLVGIGNKGINQAVIYNTAGTQIRVLNKINFTGQGNGVPTGTDGNMLAMSYFANSFGGGGGATG